MMQISKEIDETITCWSQITLCSIFDSIPPLGSILHIIVVDGKKEKAHLIEVYVNFTTTLKQAALLKLT